MDLPHKSQLRTKVFMVLEAGSRFAQSGFSSPSREILATREATCRTCEWWDADALKGTGRCKKCGCSTWAKLRMATERCPIGKWEAVQTLEPSEATRQPPSA